MFCFKAIVLINIFEYALQAKVTWLPDTSFNLPINFKDGVVPCSKQTVVFPESIYSTVQIESGTSVSEFILPIDGEIVLANGVFEIGPTDNSNCSEGSVFYLEKSISSWNQPGVWSSPKINEATPDAERIPCYDDIVEFPKNSQFTITLPDATQRVKELRIGGQSIDTRKFSEYVSTQTDQKQQFILNSNLDTGVNIDYIHSHCTSIAGCPCQNKEFKIDCAAKYCPRPTCVDPIQPIGHCCKICGGFIVLDIDQSFNYFNYMLTSENFKKEIENYDKNLVYHIGKLPDNKVQFVVVENGEYQGTSAEFINSINSLFKPHSLQVSISGTPLYKSGLGGKIFVSIFFVVAAVMGLIYWYYYTLPQLNFHLINRTAVVSRFNRRTDSVVSLTRRDSGVSTSRAFRNPLYDSTRQRVVVEESAIQESVDEN